MKQPKKTIEQAEAAGYDCGKNGANTANCDFTLFATPELTAAWERGKKRADNE
jgi:ribosome modulation factor